MIDVLFNEEAVELGSVEEFGFALDRYDKSAEFELWIAIPGDGPSMCMLRNGAYAWLMYLRFPGDSGFVSRGDASKTGEIPYRLSNGQLDHYPESWCIELERCYKALAYFFVNEGAKPTWIQWEEQS